MSVAAINFGALVAPHGAVALEAGLRGDRGATINDGHEESTKRWQGTARGWQGLPRMPQGAGVGISSFHHLIPQLFFRGHEQMRYFCGASAARAARGRASLMAHVCCRLGHALLIVKTRALRRRAARRVRGAAGSPDAPPRRMGPTGWAWPTWGSGGGRGWSTLATGCVPVCDSRRGCRGSRWEDPASVTFTGRMRHVVRSEPATDKRDTSVKLVHFASNLNQHGVHGRVRQDPQRAPRLSDGRECARSHSQILGEMAFGASDLSPPCAPARRVPPLARRSPRSTQAYMN